MREMMRAALVIARRDYAATVFSRSFLLFLIFPLLPLVAGGMFGVLGATQDRDVARPVVAVVASPVDIAAIGHAVVRLRARLGDGALPLLRMIPAPDGAKAPTRHRIAMLLADREHGIAAVLTGGPDAPVLTGSQGGIASVRREIGLIVDGARMARASGDALPPIVIVSERPVAGVVGADRAARTLLARGAQLLLMFLTMILAGMLLSNLIEEKSSKVIEVLAAAVPVDAIFLGKLFAMLAMSFTGIMLWGATLLGGMGAASVPWAGLPAPAVGWPMFLALGLAYFTTLFLLLGALFLGIGGQAGSARTVQMLSLPVTMAQMGMLGFASAGVAAPGSMVATAAALFPWSSPFAMIARAAQVPALWPHVAALVWQLLWVALAVRAAAGLFRRSVLKSGGGGWRRRG